MRLTARQEQVVDGVRRGASYDEIAREMQIRRRTVAVYVERIAARIPNPDGLRPYLAVFLWSRQ